MTEISIAFRELASVLEALESGEGDAELAAVAPVDEDIVENGAVCVNAECRIPFLKEDIMSRAEIDAQTASLSDDGALEVALRITTAPSETGSVSADSEELPRSAVDTTDETNS